MKEIDNQSLSSSKTISSYTSNLEKNYTIRNVKNKAKPKIEDQVEASQLQNIDCNNTESQIVIIDPSNT